MTDLERATERLAFAHGYALRLLDGIDTADWFRIPPAGVTHVGWQVGHMTFAEYRLTMFRIRGRLPGDSEVIPDAFLQLFGIQSAPVADPAHYPPAEQIRAAFDRVHARALQELAALDPATLSDPVDPPHTIAKTKLDSLFWCAAHELIHTGQVGLLRRQLGHAPMW